jgi:cytochrome c-type biogenesis protein CcmH
MKYLLAALMLVVPIAVAGAQAVPTEQDPVTAQRAVRLAEQLRCLVCQNQSIEESNAPLASDLRGEIREKIAQGQSDEEIIQFMVQRYGDFVLYRPRLKASTVLLWLGPALMLVLALFVFVRQLRLRRRRGDERPLSEKERAQAQRLLAGADPKDAK